MSFLRPVDERKKKKTFLPAVAAPGLNLLLLASIPSVVLRTVRPDHCYLWWCLSTLHPLNRQRLLKPMSRCMQYHLHHWNKAFPGSCYQIPQVVPWDSPSTLNAVIHVVRQALYQFTEIPSVIVYCPKGIDHNLNATRSDVNVSIDEAEITNCCVCAIIMSKLVTALHVGQETTSILSIMFSKTHSART